MRLVLHIFLFMLSRILKVKNQRTFSQLNQHHVSVVHQLLLLFPELLPLLLPTATKRQHNKLSKSLMNLISHKPGNHRPEGQTESLWHSWEITVQSHSLATWLLPSFVLARFSMRVRKGFLISEFPVIEIIPFNNAVPVPSWTASLKTKGATTVLLPRVPKVYNWINTLFLFC